MATHGRSEVWQLAGFAVQLRTERRRLGARLRQLRAHAGLTQEQVAERAGLSTSYIVRVESGKLSASLTALVALVIVYRVALGDLFAA